MGKKKDAAPKQEVAQVPTEKVVTEETRQRLYKQFQKESVSDNMTLVREVGTIFRSMGVYPTEEQLKLWIKDMEDEDTANGGMIKFDKFAAVALKIFTSSMPARDDEEKLYRAFQTLDTEGKGYLLPDELKTFMTSEGEPLTKEELDEMLQACTDPTDGKIYYDDYVSVLAQIQP